MATNHDRHLRRIALPAGLLVTGTAILLALRAGTPPRDSARPRSEHFANGEAARLRGEYDAAVRAYRRCIEDAPHDPLPYFGLVDACARAGAVDTAAAVLERILARDPSNAAAHYGLANLAFRRGRHEEALAAVRRASRLDPRMGAAPMLEGTIHHAGGKLSDALQSWSRALRLYRQAGDRAYEAWARNRIGLIQRERSEFARAQASFSEALALQRALGDRQAQEVILGNLALTQADRGDLAGAIASLDEAIRLAREIGDRAYECWLLTNLSFVDILAGRAQRAIATADSATAIARTLGDPETEVAALQNSASALLETGDYILALEASERALALADSLGDPRQIAGVLLARGEADLQLGRLARARKAYQRSDSLFRAIGVPAGLASARTGLCEVAVREGDTTRAIRNAAAAVESFSRTGYVEGEELAALLLARLHLGRRELAEAEKLCTRVVDLSRRDGRRLREGLALSRRAAARSRRGDPDGAGADARRAREIAEELHSPEILWRAEKTAADLLRTRDPEAAIRHDRAAMRSVESIQRRLRLEEFKAEYLRERLDVYFDAANLLVELDRPEEALAVCERSRARAFREHLACGRASPAPPAANALRARGQALEDHIRSLQASVTDLLSRPGADRQRLRDLTASLDAAKREWAEVRAAIDLRDPRFAVTLPDPPESAAGDVSAALAPGEALVEYFLGTHVSLGFVARRNGVYAFRIDAGAEGLAGEVEALLVPLRAPRSLTTLSFSTTAAAALGRRLLGPAIHLLEGVDRLVIVPDGALHCLPFEILAVPGGSQASPPDLGGSRPPPPGAGGFVADRWTVSYLPCASLLCDAPADTDERRSAHGLLAAGGVGGLRHSEEEVRTIAARFPGAVVLLGAEASEREVKQRGPACRYLHFSTHGRAEPMVPMRSCLELAPDLEGVDDGLLHAFEVVSLPLACEQVVLSGCETGVGRVYGGEGVLGMTRAFLHAGTERAIVSLWSVDDESTARLMESFYDALAEGLDAAAALRRAKLTLRRSTMQSGADRAVSLDHPYFWAPFIVVGRVRTNSAGPAS